MVLGQTGQELVNEIVSSLSKKFFNIEKLFNTLNQFIQVIFGKIEMSTESIHERLQKLENDNKEQHNMMKDLTMTMASLKLTLEAVSKRLEIASQLENVVVGAVLPEEKPQAVAEEKPKKVLKIKEPKAVKGKVKDTSRDELKANILGSGVNGPAQFCKWAYFHKNDFISQFITEEDKKAIASAPTLVKYTDPEDRRVEEGKFFWEKLTSEETKKKIKDLFLKWKAESKTLNDGAEIDQADSEA